MINRILHWFWKRHGMCPLCVAEWRQRVRGTVTTSGGVTIRADL